MRHPCPAFESVDGRGELILEVIVSSVEDAVEAARGGAHRLEVVRDLARDGLTPSIDLVRQIQRAVRLPLRVMVRDSDGFACGSDDERRTLAEHAAAFAALGVDGIVVGWTLNGKIDEQTLLSVLEIAAPIRATFHRAFDALADPEEALRVVGRYPQIDRVLTSAGTGTWAVRRARLQRYAEWAGERLIVLPGGGVDEDAIRLLRGCASVTEVHVGRAARVGHTVEGRVSADAVRALRRAAEFHATA